MDSQILSLSSPANQNTEWVQDVWEQARREGGESERERECGETSKGEDAKIFFQARQKSLFKIGSGVAECESGRENACGIGIRLMSNKKQGV